MCFLVVEGKLLLWFCFVFGKTRKEGKVFLF